MGYAGQGGAGGGTSYNSPQNIGIQSLMRNYQQQPGGFPGYGQFGSGGMPTGTRNQSQLTYQTPPPFGNPGWGGNVPPGATFGGGGGNQGGAGGQGTPGYGSGYYYHPTPGSSPYGPPASYGQPRWPSGGGQPGDGYSGGGGHGVEGPPRGYGGGWGGYGQNRPWHPTHGGWQHPQGPQGPQQGQPSAPKDDKNKLYNWAPQDPSKPLRERRDNFGNLLPPPDAEENKKQWEAAKAAGTLRPPV